MKRQPLVLETAPDPDAAVVWLHGLGADGHDFVPVAQALPLPSGSRIRFVFPHAPERPVTLNGGCVMPAWYDIHSLERGAQQDREGLEAARATIDALIDEQVESGIPASRIVLMGFSQGGALAVHGGLRRDRPLAGIGALSTYLPLHERLDEERHPASQDTPVFMAHGRADPVIGLNIAESARDHLLALGYRVEWHDYAMEHAVCADEVADLGRWLGACLSR